MKILFIVITALYLIAPNYTYADNKNIIAIQPLGDVSAPAISSLQKNIAETFNADVVVLKPKHLPKYALYEPRNRYRAEKLLIFLNEVKDIKYTKIIGITQQDISTSKGYIIDYGIMGYAELNKPACVISTFRLGYGKVNQQLFFTRVSKIAKHELAHTFGLGHCPNQGCLVEDVKGKMSTVDKWNGDYCFNCKYKLKKANAIY